MVHSLEEMDKTKDQTSLLLMLFIHSTNLYEISTLCQALCEALGTVPSWGLHSNGGDRHKEMTPSCQGGISVKETQQGNRGEGGVLDEQLREGHGEGV